MGQDGVRPIPLDLTPRLFHKFGDGNPVLSRNVEVTRRCFDLPERSFFLFGPAQVLLFDAGV